MAYARENGPAARLAVALRGDRGSQLHQRGELDRKSGLAVVL
ncbi:hypothetical protein [Streptomyces pseudogriseolus]